YREWILATIDSLRSRKARPDLERICRMVRRRHGSDPDRTRTELEKLIQEQTVLKVSYGSISYRNAAKVQRKSRKKSESSPTRGRTRSPARTPAPLKHQPAPPTRSSSPPPARVAETGASFVAQQRAAPSGAAAKSPPPGPRRGTNKHDGGDACGEAAAAGDAEAPPGEMEPCPPRDDTRDTTCSGSVRNMQLQQQQQRGQKRTESLEPKLRVGVLSEKSIRGGGSAATATGGHAKPLGLKEILGHLSSQERLSEEKLTRGKVKVVMEREVARGRLRRTRCGNIALPLRGAAAEEPSRAPPPPSPREDEPMETAIPRVLMRRRGRLSPVAMTTEPELIEKTTDVEIQTSSKSESPQHGAKGVCVCVHGNHIWILSHKESGVSEERGINGGGGGQWYSVNSVKARGWIYTSVKTCKSPPPRLPRFVKSEGASGGPVDWTVSDVVSYFTAAGFPEQASAFRTQEIDGKSLLLMQRNDVLTGLSIRLGPALKIYERHVKVLQKTHFEDED
uniref:Sterile alpha motif domain containing 1b n=1 Tax=Gasterosteus aculeatus TaxID=69293 RepID=G3Q4V1_GASAC